MPKLKEEKTKIPMGESDFQFSKDTTCSKWYDTQSVLLLTINADGMSGVSNIMRQTKGSEAKTPVFCPNIMKLYNNGLGGAYRLDCKSKYCFYLRMFFDLNFLQKIW